MAAKDQIDQDALAAEWGVALDAEQQAAAEIVPAAEQAEGGAEAMAAHWATMVDDGQFIQAAKGGAERILTQEEIDSLLGFSLADVNLNDNSGIRAIIDSAMVSYERLPMLEIVFDRLVRLMTTSLRNFTSDNVEVSLDRITSVRFGDYLNSIPLPAILGVFKAEEWDNSGLLTVNSNLIYSIIDVLLRRPPRPDRDPHRGPALHDDRDQPDQAHDRGGAGRRRAGVPAAVAGQVQHRSAGDQSALCRDLAAGQCGDPGAAAHRHGRPRRHHRAACCPTPPSNRSATCCCRCSWARNSAATSTWEGHLATEIGQAQIAVDAVLYEAQLPLKQIMKLNVGDTLMLEMKSDAMVIVRCGDVTLTEGRMGRVGDRVAVRVAKHLRKPSTTFAMFEMAGGTGNPMEAQ